MVNSGVQMNYQGIGSGGGIEQFTAMTVDFGASDAPMKDEEIAAAEEASGAKVLHIPTVFGAVVLAYNLEGVTELDLDPEVLAGIFLGTITKWNDPMIAALNSGLTLPDEDIQVVHRSDSSGTTNIFTGYLTQVSAEWEAQVGQGKEVEWPTGVGGQGNDGVAAVVQQQPGSIGYVELSYAVESGLAMATLQNQAGNFITPSLESTSAAAVGVTFPEDLRFSVSNSEGEQAYPIVGATWILAYDKMDDPVKADILKAWLTWALNEGTPTAEELGYAPLSEELKALAFEKIAQINGM
jgi:phosphate transport system substrate-binding protein